MSGTDNRRKKLISGENPKRNLQGRSAITITICNSDDAPESHTGEYKLHKLQERINYILYMDDIKLFAKNKKELETLTQAVRIYSDDIRMKFGIFYAKCAMLMMKCGKRQVTEGTHQENIRTLGEKETYKYFGILEVR